MVVVGIELEWGDILVIIGYFVVVIVVGIVVSIYIYILCLYDVFCMLNYWLMYIDVLYCYLFY